MENPGVFTLEEKATYQGKISVIRDKIKTYLTEQKKADFNFNKQPSAHLFENIDRAFADLNGFYGHSKRQFFNIWLDVSKNYRTVYALGPLWKLIAADYESFWRDLAFSEKEHISGGIVTFWLPNLSGKNYDQLETQLKTVFQPAIQDILKEILEIKTEIKIEVISTVDIFTIKIPQLITGNIYEIRFTAHEIRVQWKLDAQQKIDNRITEILYDFLSGYLGI